MVAVIGKRFGLSQLELGEDIVSETFLLAAETWGVRGLPPNPTAWLYAVARQKMLYQLRRGKLLNEKILPVLAAYQAETDENEPDFSVQTIRDSQLQMLFAICTPVIARDAQIGLALRILCGFGIDEIAGAFLTGKETINKRLFRAKVNLRTHRLTLELPPSAELVRRLDQVLHVIYLLFSEGYYSTTHSPTFRRDVCLEALRLGIMLTEYAPANVPKTNALLALMCFHASRFDARHGHARHGQCSGGHTDDLLVLYEEQDESRWDTALIRQGFQYLDQSMRGGDLSAYHIEARIASWHCTKTDTPEKWTDILCLYDQLLLLNPSPNVALNRIYALYKVSGADVALLAAGMLNQPGNHLYWVLLGELHRNTDPAQATMAFQRAYGLAKTTADRQLIGQKLTPD